MARAKKRRKPYTPPTQWDQGPDTQAARALKVVEDADWIDPETGNKINPNGVKRARRIDLVEFYHRKGVLDRHQLGAALKLREAYEATMRSAPAIKKVQVDTSPKPDANVAMQIDRISKFSAIMSRVLPEHRDIVACVVLDNRTPASMRQFKGRNYQAGLDLLAAALTALRIGLDRK